jgi:hypothetical protein
VSERKLKRVVFEWDDGTAKEVKENAEVWHEWATWPNDHFAPPPRGVAWTPCPPLAAYKRVAEAARKLEKHHEAMLALLKGRYHPLDFDHAQEVQMSAYAALRAALAELPEGA